MIRGEHLHEELNDMKSVAEGFEKDGKTFEATVVKGLTLILKLLLNIRQNQVQVMPPDKMAKAKTKESNEK